MPTKGGLSRQTLKEIRKRINDFRVVVDTIEDDVLEKIAKSKKVVKKELDFPDWSHLKRKMLTHVCSPDCFSDVKNDKLLSSSEYQVYSPYFKPFLYGFTRTLLTFLNEEREQLLQSKKKSQVKYVYPHRNGLQNEDLPEGFVTLPFYSAPCGKNLTKYSDVVQLLKNTECQFLTIDNFTFDPDVRPELIVQADRCVAKLIMEDFSEGQEDVKIPIVNAVNDILLPNIRYRLGCYPGKEESVQNFMSEMHKNRECCSCTDLCQDLSKCECVKRSRKFANLNDRHPHAGVYRNRKIHEMTDSCLIFECNDDCSCSFGCLNRVVQNRVKIPLELFQTGEIGWGVRTLVDIPEGAFIASYTGKVMSEIQSEELANQPGADIYFFDLYASDPRIRVISESETEFTNITNTETDELTSEFDEEESEYTRFEEFATESYISDGEDTEPAKYFVLDARPESNIGAFMNHSCCPNVHVLKAMTVTHDRKFPSVGMFSCRFIKAGEELTWDYGYIKEAVHGRVLFCRCKTSRCRTRLL